MQELAKLGSTTWLGSGKTLENSHTASNYDHVINLVDRLQLLADFQGEQASFNVCAEKLVEKDALCPVRIDRWNKKAWRHRAAGVNYPHPITR